MLQLSLHKQACSLETDEKLTEQKIESNEGLL